MGELIPESDMYMGTGPDYPLYVELVGMDGKPIPGLVEEILNITEFENADGSISVDGADVRMWVPEPVDVHSVDIIDAGGKRVARYIVDANIFDAPRFIDVEWHPGGFMQYLILQD